MSQLKGISRRDGTEREQKLIDALFAKPIEDDEEIFENCGGEDDEDDKDDEDDEDDEDDGDEDDEDDEDEGSRKKVTWQKVEGEEGLRMMEEGEEDSSVRDPLQRFRGLHAYSRVSTEEGSGNRTHSSGHGSEDDVQPASLGQAASALVKSSRLFAPSCQWHSCVINLISNHLPLPILILVVGTAVLFLPRGVASAGVSGSLLIFVLTFTLFIIGALRLLESCKIDGIV